MGTVISTGEATATAYGNQRKIDRAQNGVLWSAYPRAGVLLAAYSTDNGGTWAEAAVINNSSPANVSLFIDLDDYAHVVYKQVSDGYIYYRRGTPNTARTAYTWSAATVLHAATVLDFPDIVAFRDPATAGAWVAYAVASRTDSSIYRVTGYRINITAGGTISAQSAVDVSNTVASGNGNPAYASIDFNHTGDGKTVAGGTPHLYVGWSAGNTGAGYGIRFRKATYSAGSWTWGTEREIDNTHFISNESRWLNCMFDGTRVIFTGWLSGPDARLKIYERDAADMNTTNPYSGPAGDGEYFFIGGSASYDALGVHFFGTNNAGTAFQYRKWTRSANTMSAATVLDASPKANPYASARRGPQGQAIDVAYMDGASSPYTVTSSRIVLNQNPTAPDLLTPADNAPFDSSADRTVTFRHNDPDGDAASSYRIRYRPAGCTSAPYAYLTGSTTAANAGTVTVTVPAGTWVGQIEWAAQTYDPSNAEGAWSVTRTATGIPSALAALTGGPGGTSASALDLYNQAQVERALRALALV